MFVLIVQKYRHIAFLLSCVFLLKITVADGQWLITSLTGVEYMHYNPFCKKENAARHAHLPTLDDEVPLQNHVAEVSGICTSQFIPEDPETSVFRSEIQPLRNTYRSCILPEPYSSKECPPPK